MIHTTYFIADLIVGDVRTTTSTDVAEQCSRNGARVTAETRGLVQAGDELHDSDNWTRCFDCQTENPTDYERCYDCEARL